MKKFFYCLLVTILMFCNNSVCSAEEIPPTVCDHVWQQVLPSDQANNVAMNYVTSVDAHYHAIGRRYPDYQCTLCGETSGFSIGAGSLSPHSFSVLSFEYDQPSQTVSISFFCQVCNEHLTLSSTKQAILDGASDDCLTGGSCSNKVKCFINSDGIIVPVDSSMEWTPFSAVVTNADNDYFVRASREYCCRCGKPSMLVYDTASGTLPTEWASFDLLSAEDFLSKDMPASLPYQLIELLRSPAFFNFSR